MTPEPTKKNRRGVRGFKESESGGVRDVDLKPLSKNPFIALLRFLPLVLLAIGVVGGTSIGVWYKITHPHMDPSAVKDTRVVPDGHGAEKHLGSIPAAQDVLAGGSDIKQACAPNYPLEPQVEVWGQATLARNPEQNEAAYLAGHEASGHPYVAGKDSFVFWNDAQVANFSQAVGRTKVNAEQIKAWGDYFAALGTKLQAEGKTLLIVPAPAKWEIYPEMLPDWATAMRAQGSLSALIKATPGLPWVDTRAALVNAKTEGQTYARNNSHWTPWGAQVASKQILECLAVLNPDMKVAPAAYEGLKNGDAPNEFREFGIAQGQADWTTPQWVSPPLGTIADPQGSRETSLDEEVNFANIPAVVTNPAGAPIKVLFMRDSQGNSLSSPLDMVFGTVIHEKANLDGEPRPDVLTLAKDKDAGLVIYEFTQRYLSLPAPVMP
ncbi:MAG: hypothetical protein Q4G30_04790 [Actinomycetaceae bacterium]|nr:hypothetical protein [Actinomycetaceae bacterium]